MKICLTDVETTGLRSGWHDIIELACIIFDSRSLKIHDTFEAKISPMYPQRLDPEAQKVNGFNEREWQDSFGLFNTMSHYNRISKDAVFCAYNVIFDNAFIQEALKQLNLIPGFKSPKLDLLSMAYTKLPNLKSYSLMSVCNALDIPQETYPHRAMNGVMTEFEVFKKLMI